MKTLSGEILEAGGTYRIIILDCLLFTSYEAAVKAAKELNIQLIEFKQLELKGIL